MSGDRRLRWVELASGLAIAILVAATAADAQNGGRSSLDEVSALREHARRLTVELEKARAARDRSLEELREVQESAREASRAALDRDVEREAAHQETIRQREQELDGAARRVAALEAKLGQSRDEQKRVEADLAKSLAARREIEADLTKSRAEQQSVQSALEESREKRKAVESALDESREAHRNSESALAESRENRKRTEGELEESRAEQKRIETALAESRAERARAESALAETRQSLTETSQSLTETRQSLTETRQSLTDESSRREQAEASLVTLRKELLDQAQRIEASETRIRELETSLATGQAALRARDVALRDLDAELVRLRTEGERRIGELQAEVADLAAVREQAEKVRTLALRHAARADDLSQELELVRKALSERDRALVAAGTGEPNQDPELRSRLEELQRQLAEEQEGRGMAAALAQKLERERDAAVARLEDAKRAHREALEKQTERVVEREREVATDPEFASLETETNPEELRRQLALERQNRTTLEGELLRLSASGEVAERYRESWEELQRARAELLLLGQRLKEEQQKREEIEMSIAEARKSEAAGTASGAPLDRLVEVADDHSRTTEKLEGDLERANDEIVRLKNRLETIDSSADAGPVLTELHTENEKLRVSLRTAETTIVRLESQAALAKRLAELVYSR